MMVRGMFSSLTLGAVKDANSAVLDAVEDVLDGAFLPTEDVDVEGMGV